MPLQPLAEMWPIIFKLGTRSLRSGPSKGDGWSCCEKGDEQQRIDTTNKFPAMGYTRACVTKRISSTARATSFPTMTHSVEPGILYVPGSETRTLGTNFKPVQFCRHCATRQAPPFSTPSNLRFTQPRRT